MVKKSDNQQEQQATLHEEFSIAEAAAITGVASNHIQQWMDLGWVKPSIQRTSGEKTRAPGSLPRNWTMKPGGTVWPLSEKD
jgi:hypothetical protein